MTTKPKRSNKAEYTVVAPNLVVHPAEPDPEEMVIPFQQIKPSTTKGDIDGSSSK
jgi:hypothetical protein